MTDDEIVNTYVGGISCHRQYSMFMRGEHFSIIYHRAHASYTDRMSGTKNCSSCWAITRNGARKYGGGRSESAEVIEGGRMNKIRRALLAACLKSSDENNAIILPDKLVLMIMAEKLPQTTSDIISDDVEL